MPTFLILKSARESQRITGANPKALQDAVQSLAREAENVDSSSSSSATPGSTWLGASLPRGYSDVTEHVDVRGLDLLNRDAAFGTARTLFENTQPAGLTSANSSDTKDWVESDTDAQLLFYIPFNSTLKVHSLHLTSLVPPNTDEITRPKALKIFQNTTHNLGFDEADSVTATQEVELAPGAWDEKTKTAKVELRFVKFQKCSSLVVFVVEGEGDAEKTRVDRVRIVGEAGEKKAMGKLEKIGDETGE